MITTLLGKELNETMVTSPKELKIHLKSIKPFMEVTKRTELPESLAFKGKHPEKLRVLSYKSEYSPTFKADAGAWMHLSNSLNKLLQQTARLDLTQVTQP